MRSLILAVKRSAQRARIVLGIPARKRSCRATLKAIVFGRAHAERNLAAMHIV